MSELVRRMPWTDASGDKLELLLSREWLVTNGLGGYASGTISGASTRRYHGLLIAALPAPHGRMMMLNYLAERIKLADGTTVKFGGAELADGSLRLHGSGHLREFRLECGLPVWRFEVAGVCVEKRLFISYMQNTVHVVYRLVEGAGPIKLRLRPSVNIRPHDAPVSTNLARPYVLSATTDRYELTSAINVPPLRLHVQGRDATFTLKGKNTPEFLYRTEEERGYDYKGDLWSPGYFSFILDKDHEATLVASTESWEKLLALSPDDALASEKQRRERLVAVSPAGSESKPAAELVLAADQFIVTPSGRVEESARAHALGDEVRTVIAGYHWFTDWGRDTMISLEGLTLTTGRTREAGYILRTFAHYVRDGLIPNLFPEGEKEGLYHTADATLWFFHALYRYLGYTKDHATLKLLLPTLQSIVDHHLRGTHFNIHVDPEDGLLSQGAEGYQLTWMDAKVDGWVVTPRRGKAVEINALWYNALCLLKGWLDQAGDTAAAGQIAKHADRTRQSFNRRFWNPKTGYLFDVVDGPSGNDAACRPNQVFAISLDHPVLAEEHWQPVLDVVREKLLTPVGLRSLAPGNPDYKPQYYGDLRARDAAYHQGTVWAWLIGPFIDAWLRVHPREIERAHGFLLTLVDHLSEACLGSISEIFDAEAPYTPRGCIAQAWSIAEVLRCWSKTASLLHPADEAVARGR